MNALEADWLRYANQGAIRSQPLSERLTGALGTFLPDLGVEVEVFSGGQPQAGQGPRTGSTRHDDGNAADVFFYQGGRRLSWENEADIPVLQEIVRRGRQAGLTGFGAGPGYMQPGSMHIGFGGEAVWGAGGRGANAPDWLVEAYQGTPQGQPQAQPAMNALAAGPSAPPQGGMGVRQQANALAMPVMQFQNELNPEDFRLRRRA